MEILSAFAFRANQRFVTKAPALVALETLQPVANWYQND